MIDDIVEIPVRYPPGTTLDTVATGWLDAMVMPFEGYGNRITISAPLWKYKAVSSWQHFRAEHTFLTFERMDTCALRSVDTGDPVDLYPVMIKTIPYSQHNTVSVYRPLLSIAAASKRLNGKESLSFRTIQDIMRISELTDAAYVPDTNIVDETTWDYDTLQREYVGTPPADMRAHFKRMMSLDEVAHDPVVAMARHAPYVCSTDLRIHLAAAYRSRGYGWSARRFRWNEDTQMEYTWPFQDDDNKRAFAELVTAALCLPASTVDMTLYNEHGSIMHRVDEYQLSMMQPGCPIDTSMGSSTFGLIATAERLVELNAISCMRLCINWIDEMVISFRHRGHTRRVYSDLGILSLCSHILY